MFESAKLIWDQRERRFGFAFAAVELFEFIRHSRIEYVGDNDVISVVVLLKPLLEGKKRSYADLSKELYISASEIHAAVRRGIIAGLIDGASSVASAEAP